jgi:hypothetical protein
MLERSMLPMLVKQLRRASVAVGCLVATAVVVPLYAQSGANIAGNYRGLMTRCIGLPQQNICRTGLQELARLADEVDARRADWEAIEAGGDLAEASAKRAGYVAAMDRLNRGIVDFNRDVAGAPKVQ